MTDLKSSIQVVLQDAGYQTWLVSFDGLEAIGFEDDSAMGFAYVFEDAITMLGRWRALETKLLTRYAPALQKAGEKTWNIYSVFLCAELATPDQFREIRWIEEDLERTRKIAGCGLTSNSDVVTTLLPLLPLQYQPVLDREDFDLTQRLLKRIANIAPTATDAALDNEILPSEVVRLLLGAEI
jgi:hypothetical protein